MKRMEMLDSLTPVYISFLVPCTSPLGERSRRTRTWREQTSKLTPHMASKPLQSNNSPQAIAPHPGTSG